MSTMTNTNTNANNELVELRQFKQQILETLNMLETSDPVNTIMRLNGEMSTLKSKVEQLQGLLETERHGTDIELDRLVTEFRGEKHLLEREIEYLKSREEYYQDIHKIVNGENHMLACEIDELKDKLFHAQEETMATRGHLDKDYEHHTHEIADLKREIQSLEDNVSYWRMRHRATWHKAERLRRSRGEWKALAQRADTNTNTVPPSPSSDAAPAPASSSSFKEAVLERLNQSKAAEEEARLLNGEKFKEAVLERLNQSKAAEDDARRLNGEKFKEAVRARLNQQVKTEEVDTRRLNGEKFKEAVRARLNQSKAAEAAVAAKENHEGGYARKLLGLLDACNMAVGVSNKTAAATQVMLFLKDHGMSFLRSHVRFYYTFIAKCWEFKSEYVTCELSALLNWHIEQSKGIVPSKEKSETFRAVAVRLLKMAENLDHSNIPESLSVRRTRTQTGVIPRRDYTLD